MMYDSSYDSSAFFFMFRPFEVLEAVSLFPSEQSTGVTSNLYYDVYSSHPLEHSRDKREMSGGKHHLIVKRGTPKIRRTKVSSQ